MAFQPLPGGPFERKRKVEEAASNLQKIADAAASVISAGVGGGLRSGGGKGKFDRGVAPKIKRVKALTPSITTSVTQPKLGVLADQILRSANLPPTESTVRDLRVVLPNNKHQSRGAMNQLRDAGLVVKEIRGNWDANWLTEKGLEVFKGLNK